MQKQVFYIELLRVIGAFAVVAIHVLGPYRAQLGHIPDIDWFFAVLINGATRWAVPVFIMISGALMLSDTRPFSLPNYVSKRAMKVFIPFIIWSVFYALLAAISLQNVNFSVTEQRLTQMWTTETYYHLGFFYYFLPLYLVIPFLRSIAQRSDPLFFHVLLGIWVGLCGLRLAGWNFGLPENLLLYGGYLLLGYMLHRSEVPLKWLVLFGVIALVATEYTVITESLFRGSYTSAGWFSYKTLNTVLVAAMIFGLCKRWAERISPKNQQWLAVLSRQSLGIYLIHPIFLWPLREWDGVLGHAWLTIPMVTITVFVLSYWTSSMLSRWRWTAWLVP